jgi:hypothetical protein
MNQPWPGCCDAGYTAAPGEQRPSCLLETYMQADHEADKLYRTLMQMHEETFDAGLLEVSYHLLAAALHAAEKVNDIERLGRLETLATQRQAEIDRTQPQHKVSSASANGRGNFALFTSLSAIASAARGRIAADQAVARIRHEASESH